MSCCKCDMDAVLWLNSEHLKKHPPPPPPLAAIKVLRPWALFHETTVLNYCQNPTYQIYGTWKLRVYPQENLLIPWIWDVAVAVTGAGLPAIKSDVHSIIYGKRWHLWSLFLGEMIGWQSQTKYRSDHFSSQPLLLACLCATLALGLKQWPSKTDTLAGFKWNLDG